MREAGLAGRRLVPGREAWVTDLEHFINGTGKHRTVVLPSELPGLAALVASFAPDGTVVGRKELLWFVVEALACGEQHESRSAVAGLSDEVRQRNGRRAGARGFFFVDRESIDGLPTDLADVEGVLRWEKKRGRDPEPTDIDTSLMANRLRWAAAMDNRQCGKRLAPGDIPTDRTGRKDRAGWLRILIEDVGLFVSLDDARQRYAQRCCLPSSRSTRSTSGGLGPAARRLMELSAVYADDISPRKGWLSGVRPDGVGEKPYVRRGAQNLVDEYLAAPPGFAWVLLTGDAGNGKSSVLWSLQSELDAVEGTVALLLSAGWLHPEDGQDAVVSVDQLFKGIVDLTSNAQRVVVLLDTVDLAVTHERLRVSLDRLVRTLPERHGVHLVLSSRPAHAGLLPADNRLEVRLLGYSYAELRALAEAMPPGSPEYERVWQMSSALFSSGGDSVWGSPLAVSLCLGLGMDGTGLDASLLGLYEALWRERIAGDRRTPNRGRTRASRSGEDVSVAVRAVALAFVALGSPQASRPAVEHAGARAAAAWWQIDSVEAERMVCQGLEMLEERGIVRASDVTVRFFHQTFFEYAAAKALIVQEGASEVGRLATLVLDDPWESQLGPVLEWALALLYRDVIDAPFVARTVDRLLGGSVAHQRVVLGLWSKVPDALRERPDELFRLKGSELRLLAARLLNIRGDGAQAFTRTLERLLGEGVAWHQLFEPLLYAVREDPVVVLDLLQRTSVIRLSDLEDQTAEGYDAVVILTELARLDPQWVGSLLASWCESLRDDNFDDDGLVEMLELACKLWDQIGSRELCTAMLALTSRPMIGSRDCYERERGESYALLGEVWIRTVGLDVASDPTHASDAQLMPNGLSDEARSAIRCFGAAYLISTFGWSDTAQSVLLSEIPFLLKWPDILERILTRGASDAAAGRVCLLRAALTELMEHPDVYRGTRVQWAGHSRVLEILAKAVPSSLETGGLRAWTCSSAVLELLPAGVEAGISGARKAMQAIWRDPAVLDQDQVQALINAVRWSARDAAAVKVELRPLLAALLALPGNVEVLDSVVSHLGNSDDAGLRRLCGEYVEVIRASIAAAALETGKAADRPAVVKQWRILAEAGMVGAPWPAVRDELNSACYPGSLADLLALARLATADQPDAAQEYAVLLDALAALDPDHGFILRQSGRFESEPDARLVHEWRRAVLHAVSAIRPAQIKQWPRILALQAPPSLRSLRVVGLGVSSTHSDIARAGQYLDELSRSEPAGWLLDALGQLVALVDSVEYRLMTLAPDVFPAVPVTVRTLAHAGHGEDLVAMILTACRDTACALTRMLVENAFDEMQPHLESLVANEAVPVEARALVVQALEARAKAESSRQHPELLRPTASQTGLA
jgi:hypothetical protein